MAQRDEKLLAFYSTWSLVILVFLLAWRIQFTYAAITYGRLCPSIYDLGLQPSGL